jgi:uncharacterized SAM-binding protein YcdF (DUF218 family)
VLGAGRHVSRPEYGHGELTANGLVRLRYGAWLARRTGWPLAYSGGVGWGQGGSLSEAEIADTIVREELGTPLRWRESASRDTAQNARLSVPMLQAAGVKRIVLVTQASHMPRALRWFRAAAGPGQIDIVAAPTDFIGTGDSTLLDWVPTARGAHLVQAASHEIFGLWLAP